MTSEIEFTRNPNLSLNENGLLNTMAFGYEAPIEKNVHAAHADNTLYEERWRKAAGSNAELKGPRPAWWWTGPTPKPGVEVKSLPAPNLATATRESMLDYFNNTWLITETLFAGLQGEVPFYKPPYHQLRHPLVFYYGHAAVVYVNKLRVAGVFKTPVDPFLEQIMETGVDEMSWDDLSKNEMEWPSIRTVAEYRRKVYQLVVNVIRTHPDLEPSALPITQKSPLWGLVMGFEHERIHIETSSVLIRELPIGFVKRPENWPAYHSAICSKDSVHPPSQGLEYPENSMISVPAGTAVLGKDEDFPEYGWDNEYGVREIHVGAFKAAKYHVTNGEFWEFVNAGGYHSRKYWSEKGWAWRTFRNAKWPTYWVAHGPQGLHQYKLRVVFDIVEMSWSCPAIINYHEGRAYAAWRSEKEGLTPSSGYHLLSEAMFHRIAGDDMLDKKTDHALEAGGESMPEKYGYNIQLAMGSECPVDALPANKNGFCGVFGNAWQWGEDHFAALEGFDVHRIYDDFSTPCFDGEHNMILGGSFISTGDQASKFARYSFRPHFFQHAGVRLAIKSDPILELSCMDAPSPHVGDQACCTLKGNARSAAADKYTEQCVHDSYLALHYGEPSIVFPYPGLMDQELLRFPKQCTKLLTDTAKRLDIPLDRALDIGCSVGGAVFAMGESYKEVIGIDLSQPFIDTANRLLRGEEVPFSLQVEGNRDITAVASCPEQLVKSEGISFRRGDACCLPLNLGMFDAILIANLLDRVPSPKAALGRVVGPTAILRSGGLLLITSPNTWLERHTPKSAWLAGQDPADSFSTLDALHAILDPEYDLIEEKNLPLIIREHLRKYELIVSQASLWRRR